MLHAKILMIDGFVSLGSSNFNHRSFFKDLEMDVVLSQPKSKQVLHEQFLEDLKHCEKRELGEWKKRSFTRKLLELLFYQFRGML
jgi:cardiolipin synthase